MADAVLALADRPEDRRRMAASGAKVVNERYARKPLALAALRTLEAAVAASKGTPR
jgi:hypothetical protein